MELVHAAITFGIHKKKTMIKRGCHKKNNNLRNYKKNRIKNLK